MISMIDSTIARMMPCSTPTAKTTTAVTAAITNSLIRAARIRFRPSTSTSPTPIRNTIAASTAVGMSVSPLVKNSTTTRTTSDMVRFATWVRPLCSSRIWVLVGLPFTTKVPLSPAARLAPARPTMSRFTSTRWLCFIAKLREVAALWAMMRTKQEKAIPRTLGTSLQVIPSGSPIGGNPPCTAPTTATPCAEASRLLDRMIDAITATTAPGTTGRNRLKPRMMINVPTAKATVQPLASDTWVIVDHCCSNQLPLPLGMPSMPGTCPERTEMPTPVRNPMSTEALRKSPRKPSLSNLATTSSPPQTSATRLVQASHSVVFGSSPAIPRPARPAARIAAVAESAPTTSSREEPSRANTMVGKMTVYKPVTTGVCAIDV